MIKFFLTLFVSLSCLCVFAADNFSLGRAAYQKKNYSLSQKYFLKSLKTSPNNVNCRYYYAQSLMATNNINEAIKQYKIVIMQKPKSGAGILSKKSLENIQNYYSSPPVSSFKSGGENYLENIKRNNKLYRFKNMPIYVYIEPVQYKVQVENAFKDWQSASSNRVTFVFTNSIKNAQIIVRFKNSINARNTEGTDFISGMTYPQFSGNYIIKSEIFIATKNPNTQKILDGGQIRSCALHEIGHAIGLWGHSSNSSDLMSPKRNGIRSLNNADINTVILLYGN